MRELGFYVYASVKGGTGKSTLAVCTAKILASQGRKPVVLDLSFLGTSLADGLAIVAPIVEERDGFPDYTLAPSGQWHDLATTRELREQRRLWCERNVSPRDEWLERAPAPPFLNDGLRFNEAPIDYRGDAMLWRDAVGAYYLPASPLREDAIRIASYACVSPTPQFPLIRRLTWFIDSVIRHNKEITDIILDLPSGTLGIPAAVFVLIRQLNDLPSGFPPWKDRVRWRVAPTLVTSVARNDWLPAVEYWRSTRQMIPALRLIINRAPPVWESGSRETLAPILALKEVQEIRIIGQWPGVLGRLFIRGDWDVVPELEGLKKELGLADEECKVEKPSSAYLM